MISLPSPVAIQHGHLSGGGSWHLDKRLCCEDLLHTPFILDPAMHHETLECSNGTSKNCRLDHTAVRLPANASNIAKLLCLACRQRR